MLYRHANVVFSLLCLPSVWGDVPHIIYAMSGRNGGRKWLVAVALQTPNHQLDWTASLCSKLTVWPLQLYLSWCLVLPVVQKAAIFECNSVDKHTHTHTRINLKDQQLPGCHAGIPQTPKLLYGVVLKCPPSGGFQYDIRGPKVTSSSPFFSSFHVPLFLPLSNF